MIMFSRLIHDLDNATANICNINYVVATIFHCVQFLFCSLPCTTMAATGVL
nr:MAG TPA: hypothetical protein [Caudoviricetes sp.]